MTAQTREAQFDAVFGAEATAETCREMREDDARRADLDAFAGKYDDMAYAAKCGIAKCELEVVLIRLAITCECAASSDVRPWVRERLESIMAGVRRTLERVR